MECIPPSLQLPHHLALEAEDLAIPREGYQRHRARLARLEAHRGSRGDVQPHAVGDLAIEAQRIVGLEEVIVRADLDRTIAAIGHLERRGPAALVDLDVARGDFHFTWD